MPSIEDRWIVHAPFAETPSSPNPTALSNGVSFNLTLANGRDNGQERVQGIVEFTRPQFPMRSIERYQVLRKTTLLLSPLLITINYRLDFLLNDKQNADFLESCRDT